MLINELKKQGYTPVIFFHINTKNSFNSSEWHYEHLIENNIFPNEVAVDEFLKQFDTTPEVFLDEIKILDCEYFCSFYTDDDFINHTGVDFSCDPLSNRFLNDHGHKIIQEFLDDHPPGTNFWGPSSLLVEMPVTVNLRARYVACRNMQIKFEKEHDVQFEYTMITRPEMIYRPNFKKLDTDTISYCWDHIIMYPDYIHRPIMDNIVPIIQSITILVSNTPEQVLVNHFIERTFLDLNDMSHYYKKPTPVRFELNLIKNR